MSENQFFKSLIGKPWVSGARGPDSFDCWGLLCHVYLKIKGVALPIYPNLDASDASQKIKMGREERLNWTPLETPHHLCAVGMSANEMIHHVGIWLDIDGGGVLHSTSVSGVIFQPLISLRNATIQNINFFSL